MADPFETYRGTVHPWECDMVEHFTVAYYFDRFSDAVLGAMEALGLGRSYMESDHRTCATIDCYVRYLNELRAGDILHIESGVISVDDKRMTLGHKVYNSAAGTLCATLEQLLLHFDMDARKSLPFTGAQRERVAAGIIDWDGEPRETRYTPDGEEGFLPTGRDTVKPWEIDVIGHMGFQFFVHRFTAGMIQALAAFGLTPEFMATERCGFSTFEFQMRFFRELSVGDLVEMKSGIMHVGGSSMRVLHRLFNVRTGVLSAELSQYGVLLDMDARRPTRVPDEMRERAAPLLIPEPEE